MRFVKELSSTNRTRTRIGGAARLGVLPERYASDSTNATASAISVGSIQWPMS